MRITVEIDPHEVREDETRAYEKAVSSFAEEWLKLLAREFYAGPRNGGNRSRLLWREPCGNSRGKELKARIVAKASEVYRLEQQLKDARKELENAQEAYYRAN